MGAAGVLPRSSNLTQMHLFQALGLIFYTLPNQVQIFYARDKDLGISE